MLTSTFYLTHSTSIRTAVFLYTHIVSWKTQDSISYEFLWLASRADLNSFCFLNWVDPGGWVFFFIFIRQNKANIIYKFQDYSLLSIKHIQLIKNIS